MSNFNEAVFTDIEEIGFRLKAVRLSSRTSINTLREGAMTHVAYTSVEDGRGSIGTLDDITKILEKTVEITLFAGDKEVAKTDILGLRNALSDYRKDNDIARATVARTMGVPYASVNVFENAEKPRVRSFSRFISALGLRAEYVVKNADGTPVIPSEILTDKDKLKALRDELKGSVEKDMTEVKADNRLGDQIKALREKLGLSKAEASRLAGIKDASMAKVELSNTRLTTATKVVEGMGYELRAVVGDKNIPTSELPQLLDDIRVSQGYTPSDFAREIGTTYRAVKIFPESQASLIILKRYIDGLKINVRYKLVKKAS